MNQVNPFLKMIVKMTACIYIFSYFGAGTYYANAYIQNKNQVDSHHVIFDNLGKLSTGITYINVAIPLNTTVLYRQISTFESFLDEIINANISTTERPIKSTKPEHDAIDAQNMQRLIQALVSYVRNRLIALKTQLDTVNDLLPQDATFDRENERHKRFLFMIPLIVCEVNKKNRNDEYYALQRELNGITDELDNYKREYAKLYNETMPEIVDEYIEQNYDFEDQSTLFSNAKALERQTRDVKFLLNVIKREKRNANPNAPPERSTPSRPTFKPKPRSTSPLPPSAKNPLDFLTPFKHDWSVLTTPDPFRDFENLFSKRHNHIPRKPNSTFMAPKPPNSKTITLNVPPPPQNIPRNKRFVVTAALVTGVLGTFFGLYNTIKINKIQDDLKDLQSSQKLLIQMTKTMEHQILSLNAGLSHLEQIFALFIKNNPALLYAKFNDLLMSLQDRIHSLQDTLQMLQLQKLSTNTLTSTQLFNLYDEVEQVAKVNKLSLLTSKPQDFFQLDTSYIRVKDEILILLHVPCASPQNLLTIYKYVPFPIPVLPKANPNSTEFDTIQAIFDVDYSSSMEPIEGVHFEPEADLIAIGKNDRQKNRFILLSSAELQACTKRSTAFICERHQVTRSDLLSSCLGSLFLQSSQGVLENCKIDRVKLREKVYQLSNTQHIVYSPQPINTQIICNNGSYYPLKIKNTKFIVIPEGCSTELANHTISSDHNIRTTSQSIYFEWDFDPTTLPNSASMLIDARTVDIKIQHLKGLVKQINDDTIDSKEFDAMMTRHYSSGSWLSNLMLLLLTFSALIGLGSIGICVKNFIAKGRTVVTDDHIVHQRNRTTSESDDERSHLHRSSGFPLHDVQADTRM